MNRQTRSITRDDIDSVQSKRVFDGAASEPFVSIVWALRRCVTEVSKAVIIIA